MKKLTDARKLSLTSYQKEITRALLTELEAMLQGHGHPSKMVSLIGQEGM